MNKSAIFSLFILISTSANAALFQGEIQLGAATTLRPRTDNALFTKNLAIRVDTGDLELSQLTAISPEIQVIPGDDDVCSPRDQTIIAKSSAGQTAIAVMVNDVEPSGFASGQLREGLVNIKQDYDLPVDSPAPSGFSSKEQISFSVSPSLSSLTVNAKRAVCASEVSLLVELKVEVTGKASISSSNVISNQNIQSVRVHFRAYPKEQNPSSLTEEVKGFIDLSLVH